VVLGKSDLYNRGLLKLSRALKDVRHLHGQLGVDVVQDHIIEDRHTKDPARIDAIRAVLSQT
jgi:hypothetical protein